MKPIQIILSLITIVTIVLFPHLGLLPNFTYAIPILILVWFTLKLSNQNFEDVGFSFKRFHLRSIPIGGVVAIFTLAFMQCIFHPILDLIVSLDYDDVGLHDFIKEGPIQLIFMIFFGWLIGGVYEEIVFHGFIFTRIEKIIGGKYATLISFVLTSLLFGAYHIQLGYSGAINALFVGVVYQALFLQFNRNLWYSILCHGFYNTTVMLLIYLGYL